MPSRGRTPGPYVRRPRPAGPAALAGASDVRRRERAVPVVLGAGHLGVGKSSLVNHLLRHADGTRIGVVVNDFGALGIDAMLVAGQADAVTSLANGCLCCNTDADGLSALLADLTTPATGLDLVVVEASG